MWKSKEEKEPLIIVPEDWNKEEFVTICKLFGLPPESTERIVLREKYSVEYYLREIADRGKKYNNIYNQKKKLTSEKQVKKIIATSFIEMLDSMKKSIIDEIKK